MKTSANGTLLESVDNSDTKDGVFVIPDGVTTIGCFAFNGCHSLTSITIPSSVITIGDIAFYGCHSLTSITISSSVTTIGNGAFDGCQSLTSITIPSSVITIGDGAFNGCHSLTSITIPSSVTAIGGGAFYGCQSLTSITIPSSVTTIIYDAFNGCHSLTSITIPSSVTTIGNIAFNGCHSLTSITIPSSVTTIGYGAFNGCHSLTSITIPSSVITISRFTFYDCHSLTSITIPSSVTAIGGGAFYGCQSLTSITIPSSVTTIGDGAFEGCQSLTSITIPSSVITIGYGAFNGCKNIKHIIIDDTNNHDYMRIKALVDSSYQNNIIRKSFYDELIKCKNAFFVSLQFKLKTSRLHQLGLDIQKVHDAHLAIEEFDAHIRKQFDDFLHKIPIAIIDTKDKLKEILNAYELQLPVFKDNLMKQSCLARLKLYATYLNKMSDDKIAKSPNFFNDNPSKKEARDKKFGAVQKLINWLENDALSFDEGELAIINRDRFISRLLQAHSLSLPQNQNSLTTGKGL